MNRSATHGFPRRAARWLFSLTGAVSLLVTAALIGLAVAGYLSWRNRALERIIETYTLAEARYRNGEMGEARDGFARALSLIDRIGDPDHFLRAEIRRKHGESRVIADLLPIGLEEVARRAYSAPSPDVWRQTFQGEHRTRTVIFDAVITARPGPSGTPGVRIGYEVWDTSGGADAAREVVLDFEGGTLFADSVWRAGTRVIFAATLDDMSLGPNGRWSLSFAPDGYVVIRDEQLLKWAGFEVSGEVAQAIAHQRDLLDRAHH